MTAERPFAPEPVEPAAVLRCLERHVPGEKDAAIRQIVHWAFEGRIAGLSEYLSQPERREERSAMARAFRMLGLLDERDMQ